MEYRVRSMHWIYENTEISDTDNPDWEVVLEHFLNTAAKEGWKFDSLTYGDPNYGSLGQLTFRFQTVVVLSRD